MLQKVSPGNSLDTPRPEAMVAPHIAVGSQKMEDLRQKLENTTLATDGSCLTAYSY